MTPVLFINDNNLLLQTSEQQFRTQGYAWLKQGGVYFDFDEIDNAVAACRLEPQQINSRYWQQCEQTSIPGNDSGMRHAADLVWRHLSELKARHTLDELILIVPSHYQAANLELLLGIAGSCDLSILGLVNKSVLAVAGEHPSAENILHVDIQLHQTVCSQVKREGQSWSLGAVEVLHEVGLHGMQDALLRAAQERFIQSDRFDPLHYAETEQQLFDQLPRLAADIAQHGKANMSVVQSGNQHSCSIDAKQWQAALQGFSDALQNAVPEFQPEIRMFDFNGFGALILEGDGQSTIEQSGRSAKHLDALTLADSQGHLVYLTEIPIKSNAESSATPVTVPEKQPPMEVPSSAPEVSTQPTATETQSGHATHLLLGGVAVPIGRAGISFNAGQVSLEPQNSSNLAEHMNSGQLFIVGDEQRRDLRVNDRLGSNLADGVLTVIRVE